MHKGMKIVVVVPAGRKRYLELQLPYVLKQKGLIDEYRYWVNTINQEDIAYMEKNAKDHPSFITLDKEQINETTSYNIYKFFTRTIDPNTVYLRIDDDIVWMDKDAITKLIEFRIENPKYFLVYGNIINNTICDHIHQRFGIYDNIDEFIDYNCMGSGWNNPPMAIKKHEKFFKNLKLNEIEKYKFSRWELSLYERVSINCIAWFGSEFKKFDGIVDSDEEQWLACIKPQQLGKPNCICGNALFSHYAYYVQRETVEKTNILESYKSLLK